MKRQSDREVGRWSHKEMKKWRESDRVIYRWKEREMERRRGGKTKRQRNGETV
jgi:hypothetical protein